MDQVRSSSSSRQAADAEQRPDPIFRRASRGVMIAFFLLAQFVVETGYFIFWEMVSERTLAGKDLVGLRVVRRDGLPIDLRSSVVRNVMRIVDMLPENYVVG